MLQILLNGLIAGLLYSLVALGFSLIYRATKVFHIAHGAVYTAAAYFFLAWLSVIKMTQSEFTGLTLICAILFALASTSLLILAMEKFVYRPLFEKKAPPLVTFISSLGLYIIIVNLVAMVFGNETKVLNPTIEPSFAFGNIIITRIQIVQLIISILLICLVFYILRKTSLGKKIRALSDNSILASVLGLKVRRIRLMAFFVGSALAAIASILVAFDVGMDPQVGLSAVLTAAVAFIIGGIHSYAGAVFGALLIGITQNIVIWYASAQWQEAATFIVLILVLLFRQEGLFMQEVRIEEA